MSPRELAPSACTAISLALGAVAVLASMPVAESFGTAVDGPQAPRQPAAHVTSVPTPLPGVCRVDADSGVAPPAIFIEETAVITTHLTAQCTPRVFPLHVVLLLDASSDLDPMVRDAIRDTGAAMVRCILTEDDPWRKVAVLDYAATARQLCPFSSYRDAQLSCVARSRPRAGRRVDSALTAARSALDRERNRLPDWIGVPEDVVREVVVLVAGGENDTGCTSALREASSLKRRGVLVMSVWANAEGSSACLRQMATSARYYYEPGPGAEPCRVFGRIREDSVAIGIQRLTITHTLPAHVVYEPSGDPELAPTALPGYLVWSTSFVPRDGYTVTARLKPLEVGRLRIVSETRAAWSFGGSRKPGSLTIPGPELDVLPHPTATPTAPPTLTPPPTVRTPRPLYVPAANHP